jgi:hypothetical protein
MSIRPRILVPFVVAAFLLIGAAGCSNGGQASVNDSVNGPNSDESEETSEPPCEATATVDGITYHVVRAVNRDYAVEPTVQVEGEATDCSGGPALPMTFHAIPKVDPSWAVCGLVDGEWRVFLADDIQVPANTRLARIVAGG